jgi:Holliday junction resolvase RusA-like endonuclease
MPNKELKYVQTTDIGLTSRCSESAIYQPLANFYDRCIKMAKRKFKLSVRIPQYQNPKNSWKQTLHAIIRSAARKSGISYHHSDKLELKVNLYMDEKSLSSYDIDNRLKDIMDALQGRAGGPKKFRYHSPIIPNDRQIYRVTIEKASPPKQSKGIGHLVITRYKNL